MLSSFNPKWCISLQFRRSVVSDILWPHGLQHPRPPCPSPTPGVYSNSCPLSQWCHPTISSSVVPFSYCLQSFPASGSFPMSQFFTSGGLSIGVSALASVLPMNIQNWFPLWTGWISLQFRRLSRVVSNTTVQKHQVFCAHLSLSFPCGSEVKASACNAEDLGLIPKSGRSSGEGKILWRRKCDSLQCSCLRGTWLVTVHGIRVA